MMEMTLHKRIEREGMSMCDFDLIWVKRLDGKLLSREARTPEETMYPTGWSPITEEWLKERYTPYKRLTFTLTPI